MSVDGDATVLVLPGLHGSGAGHWQSQWERRRPELRRVEQESWTRPTVGDWAATLERAVRTAPGPVVLLAHSLACSLVAHWARAGTIGRVTGALLVAPADVDALAPLLSLRSFAPMPRDRLPFPSHLVASANDPFVTVDRSRQFARWWGAHLHEVGPAGHLNVQSGHGPWPEGEPLLDALLRGAPGREEAGTASRPP